MTDDPRPLIDDDGDGYGGREANCCDFACYEDPGCSCDGCRAEDEMVTTPTEEALLALGSAIEVVNEIQMYLVGMLYHPDDQHKAELVRKACGEAREVLRSRATATIDAERASHAALVELFHTPHHLGFPMSGRTFTYDTDTVMVDRKWYERLRDEIDGRTE